MAQSPKGKGPFLFSSPRAFLTPQLLGGQQGTHLGLLLDVSMMAFICGPRCAGHWGTPKPWWSPNPCLCYGEQILSLPQGTSVDLSEPKMASEPPPGRQNPSVGLAGEL